MNFTYLCFEYSILMFVIYLGIKLRGGKICGTVGSRLDATTFRHVFAGMELMGVFPNFITCQGSMATTTHKIDLKSLNFQKACD